MVVVYGAAIAEQDYSPEFAICQLAQLRILAKWIFATS
jgi:hypothetical protein